MSKRKIDETMTQARIVRAKRTKGAKAQSAGATPVKRAKPEVSKAGDKKTEPKESREDLVVFAFRLTEAERDLIHRAAGPAKASRYVRSLAVAAARGDEAGVKEILRGSKPAV